MKGKLLSKINQDTEGIHIMLSLGDAPICPKYLSSDQYNEHIPHQKREKE